MAIELLRRLRNSVRGWPNLALPALVVAIGLITTCAGGYLIEQGRLAREQLRFDAVVDEANDAVAGRLDTYIAVLRAGAGLFAASQDVNRSEFRAFAERVELTRRYPGIEGIGFSIRIPPGQAPRLIARMRADGMPDFDLPPSEGETHAIIYLEPADLRNAVAPSFNMHASSVRREAMDRARDTGAPALSGKVELINAVDRDQAGFLLYEPVYEGGDVPESVSERRSRLLGFVYAPFRAGDLLSSVLASARPAGFDYAVYDGRPSAATLLYRSTAPVAGEDGLSATRKLNIAGRTWTIIYRGRPDDARASEAGLTLEFMATGALVSLLIGLATWRQVRARVAAEREIVARIAAEARQKLLLDELNHRVKNTLATVQSIAAQSLRHGTDVGSVRESFEARLIALSQAHNLLTRDNWRGASLAELARSELAPYGGAEGERVSITGEEVWLAPNTAVALGMAFHELATNAVKYGALCGPDGRVEVGWKVTPAGQDRQLRIVWREEGGPPVKSPTRRGFGSRVIVGGLAHQLDGVVDLSFPPTGAVCTIVFRLPPSGVEEEMLRLGSAA
ncbi:MAG: CHASE domain-containing protein [Pseudomonadota bacterium]|uniref:CHASE domain-containing protein n=1 Tax=Phenylobacterium sp. TaxID=1871053 RepID=UPI0025FB173C|nr:CHASE domain-containing protein [Phenylobacterium sp.]MBT9469986.1 CHASE domain-containing protein [Phenylobacterium sp.]